MWVFTDALHIVWLEQRGVRAQLPSQHKTGPLGLLGYQGQLVQDVRHQKGISEPVSLPMHRVKNTAR